MLPFVGNIVAIGKGIKKTKKVTEATKTFEGVYDLVVKTGDDVTGYVGQSKDVFKRITQHFKPKKGKLNQTILQKGSTTYKMVGSTKEQREIYEQFIILEKYGGQINPKKNPLAKLLNKVNPYGGRSNLKTPQGRKKFKEKALEIAKEYDLPTKFDPTF